MSLRRLGRPLLAAAALALGSLFIALGTWQVQRMAWKQDLVARVQARTRGAPVAPPPAQEWTALRAAPLAYEYRRLRLTGEFLHASEALVQASTVLGAGFWVLTPLRSADGSIVLVNRGFVPPQALAARGAAPAPSGTVVVTGLLRISEPGGGFLRTNDARADRWYSRDVAAIAHARALPNVAPYFVDAEATPVAPGAAPAWPAGGLTVLAFPDNHLAYALTWFVLALMVVAGAGYALWWEPRRRARDNPLMDAAPASHDARFD